MCQSMADIQCAPAKIRRGIKKDRKKAQGKNIMSAAAMQDSHNNVNFALPLKIQRLKSFQLQGRLNYAGIRPKPQLP